MRTMLKPRFTYISMFLGIYLSFFSLTVYANSTVVQDVDKQIDRIDIFLQQSVEQGFSGAMLIAKGDKILLNKGYGFADKAKKYKNNTKTVFDIGSVTKQFTATALLKLVEQKKVSLSDPLNVFFDDLPKDKQNITLHQLLTHSSGLVGGIGKGDFYHISTDKFFSELFATDLLFDPGTQFHYSNVGYSTLARVIELVSNSDYEHFIAKYLLKPAGMMQTGYLLPSWQLNSLAKGYAFNVFNVGSTVERYQKEGKIAWTLKGNGGFNSTHEDMYKWYLALRNNTILSKEYMAKLTAAHIKQGVNSNTHYAYGWGVYNSKRDTKIVTHNGSNGIFYHKLHWLVEDDLIIIYSTNAFTPDIEQMTAYVESMLFDTSYQPRQRKVDVMTNIVSTTLAHKEGDEQLVSVLKRKYGDKIKEVGDLALAAHIFFHNKYIDEATALYQLNTQLFPNNGDVWDMLGESYYEKSDFKAAKTSFIKALSLQPSGEDNCNWCSYSQARLKEIEAEIGN